MSRLSVIQFRTAAIVLTCTLVCAATTKGDASADVKALRDGVLGEGVVLSAEQGREFLRQAEELRGKATRLSRDELATLGSVECVAAAALGDAGKALELAKKLVEEHPDSGDAQRAAYIAAIAGGDGKLAYEMLKMAPRPDGEKEQKRQSLRGRWLRGVGKAAPDITMSADEGMSYDASRRANRVLLIDIWEAKDIEDDEAEGLRELYKESRDAMRFEMAGVNIDVDKKAGEQAARERGFKWDQCYEGADSQGRKELRASDSPWQVLVDAFGNVRAVGSATEPGFYYAVRAAIAEADGDYAALTPCTRTGKQPEVKKTEFEAAPLKSVKKKDSVEEKPSNPEALAKLREARAFIRTGLRSKAIALFKEIVRDYPGTPEARDAQEYLDSMSTP